MNKRAEQSQMKQVEGTRETSRLTDSPSCESFKKDRPSAETDKPTEDDGERDLPKRRKPVFPFFFSFVTPLSCKATPPFSRASVVIWKDHNPPFFLLMRTSLPAFSSILLCVFLLLSPSVCPPSCLIGVRQGARRGAVLLRAFWQSMCRWPCVYVCYMYFFLSLSVCLSMHPVCAQTTCVCSLARLSLCDDV